MNPQSGLDHLVIQQMKEANYTLLACHFSEIIRFLDFAKRWVRSHNGSIYRTENKVCPGSNTGNTFVGICTKQDLFVLEIDSTAGERAQDKTKLPVFATTASFLSGLSSGRVCECKLSLSDDRLSSL